jgi:large conductance mechanosensitive channel
VGVKDFIDGFKKFALQGNVIEIAIGLVMALAFKPVIDSLVEGILMPIVGAVFGERSFDQMSISLGDNGAEIFYGWVITTAITFAATAFALYVFVVKPYEAYKLRQASGEEEAPAPDAQTVLLTEIRDSLRK